MNATSPLCNARPADTAGVGVIAASADLGDAVAELLAGATDASAAVVSAMSMIGRSGEWGCARYLRLDSVTGKLTLEAEWNEPGPSAPDSIANRSADLALAQRAVECAIRSSRWPASPTQSSPATPAWSTDLKRDASAYTPPHTEDTLTGGTECYFPILVDGRLAGVLSLTRADSSRDEQRATALVGVVAQIGQFVERKRAQSALRDSERLYQALTRESSELRCNQDASLRLTNLLARFGQDALSIRGIPSLLDAAIATVIAGLSVDCAAVMRLSAQGNEMLIEAANGWDGDLAAGLSLYSGFATPEGFLRDRDAPLATHPADPGSDDTDTSEFLRSRGIGSALEVIIGSPLAPYGVLGAYSIVSHHFGRESVSFLQSVAGMLGTAVARLQVGENFAYLAQYDPLTNLANRTCFRDELSRQLIEAERDGTEVAVLYIDLDGFKSVNDSHGHESGDQLLSMVADRLRANVPETATIGRQGGDEFAVKIGELTDAEHALLIADHLCEELGRPFNLDGRELCVTATIGVAVFPADGATADVLIKNADTAMYQGKQQGRNNFRRYSNRLDGVAARRRRLVIELHQATTIKEEFELHYQPQVSLATGRTVGAEAFLRWWHPVHGLLAAGEFIGVAEESGLIAQISAWVLESACRQVVEWQRQGSADFFVSVNVSPLEIRRGRLPEQVRRALANSGLAARHLELELTESGLPDDTEVFMQMLHELKEIGVSIAIDNFGSTHSGLRLLKNPAIRKIKIDPSFIRNVATDPDDSTIAQSLITMAHHLQIDTVAKGVETEAQARFLRRSRCDIAQGFLFGAPMQASSFSELLTGDDSPSDVPALSALHSPQFLPLASLMDCAEPVESILRYG